MTLNNTFLVRPSNTSSYHFRSVVPLDLQYRLNCKRFQISLRTGIYRTAVHSARQLYVKVQRIYNSLRKDDRSSTKIDAIKQILNNELNSIIIDNLLVSLPTEDIKNPECLEKCNRFQRSVSSANDIAKGQNSATVTYGNDTVLHDATDSAD